VCGRAYALCCFVLLCVAGDCTHNYTPYKPSIQKRPKINEIPDAVNFKVRKANEHESSLETTPWQRVKEFDKVLGEWKDYARELDPPITEGTTAGKARRLEFITTRCPNYVDHRTQLDRHVF
jgi:hypothetical protein